jgi:cytochrome c551/c552
MQLSKTKKLLILSLTMTLGLASSWAMAAEEKPWQAIGRQATAAEVKAWDIDVRGDFKGIPKGQGTVAQGEQIWEAKCTSCHGSFGELNEVFPPIVGGTTAEDIKTGIVAANANGGVAQKTTLMKLARLSTMWDYINRAMPWNAPKSLTADEVYAVVAHILNLGGIVPSDFTLSDKNIAQVQERLPNRNGLRKFDGLWDTKGKPDVSNVACMSNCPVEEKLNSFLPDFARNAHGNLAEQNRIIGGVRGADTSKPTPPALDRNEAEKKTSAPDLKAVVKPGVVATAAVASAPATDIKQLLGKNSCTACHGMKNKIVGPGFNEIAAKHKDKPDLEIYLTKKIKTGGSGVWGAIPMPPQAQLKDADVKAIAQWLSAGAK